MTESRCLSALLLLPVLTAMACGSPAVPEAALTSEQTATPVLTSALEAPRRILFIGDSSIFYNLGHANHLEKLTISAAPPMEIEAWDLTSGSTSIEGHWGKEAALTRNARPVKSAKATDEISSGNYDAVVLYIGIHYYPVEPQREYAGKFASVIRDAGARPVLYMGWPFDPRKYPLMEDTDPFDYVAAGVHDISEEFGLDVAPVALAWKMAMAACPELELYQDDADHPTMYGTYLSVNVIYATLFGQSPIGLPYRPTQGGAVTEEGAACLQRVAWETVVEYQSEE